MRTRNSAWEYEKSIRYEFKGEALKFREREGETTLSYSMPASLFPLWGGVSEQEAAKPLSLRMTCPREPEKNPPRIPASERAFASRLASARRM